MSHQSCNKCSPRTGRCFCGLADIPPVVTVPCPKDIEIARLRGLLTSYDVNSHQCLKCLHAYTPFEDESEDCPKCGYDGK